MRKKKIGLIVGFLLMLCIALLVLRFQAQQKNKIKIGYSSCSINNGPLIVAAEKDFFGNEVELVPFKSGKEVIQALGTGRIDMGAVGLSRFFIAVSSGIPIKIIAISATSTTDLFVRPNSRIDTFSDLKGKKIGGGRGGTSELVLRMALKKEGMDYLKDINFVDIKKELRPLALVNKKVIDGVVTSTYNEAEFFKKGAVLHKEWQEKDYSEEAWPKVVIAIRSDFLEKNPEFVKAWIEDYIEVHRFISEEPANASAIISEHITSQSQGAINFSAQEVRDSWKSTKYTFWYEPEVIVNLSVIAKEVGFIEQELTEGDIFCSEYYLLKFYIKKDE